MDGSNNSIIITGLFTLVGVLLGGLLPLIRDFINNKTQLRLEKVRLHDKGKTEAYKRLFLFARSLENRIFPMAECKEKEFTELMSREYKKKVQIDYLYFSPAVREILDEFESRYVCMTHQDLIPEMHPDDEKEFLENKLFDLTQDLIKEIMKSTEQE